MATTFTGTIDDVDRQGDDVNVSATVNSFPVKVHVWFSHLQTLPDNPTRKQYIVQQCIQAFLASNLVKNPNAALSGAFSITQ